MLSRKRERVALGQNPRDATLKRAYCAMAKVPRKNRYAKCGTSTPIIWNSSTRHLWRTGGLC